MGESAGGGCGWNLWVWLVGVVVRRYIDYLILLIPTPLVSVFFTAASQLFVPFFYFSFLFQYFFVIKIYAFNFAHAHTHKFKVWMTIVESGEMYGCG